ncbi:MAG: serine hydroxymethyltransferase [Patescibacteria group bacterium]
MNQLFDFLEQEISSQQNSINLIASENYPSTKVLQLQGSVFNNKYGEGYPGKRYYAGNENTDKLESYVQKLALKVFDCENCYDVNVQTLSGSPANSMVFMAMLENGDTILSMDLANGGHLSHLHKTSNWNKFFKHISYNIKEDLSIDIDDYSNKIIQFKPKLVIIGFSSYPLAYDFAEMISIAHEHNCLVLCDIAHISGLVATGQHPSPFKGDSISQADFVTTTTHKTFRGPRGALIYSKKKYSDIINKTIFPGTSGGPHFATIAGIGQACLEILDEDMYEDSEQTFKEYTIKVKKNITALENGLMLQKIKIIQRSTNHLTLIELPVNKDSLQVQKELESKGIITNRNLIPFDKKTAWKPSGLRLGSPALTSRGADEEDFEKIGIYIGQIINNNLNETEFQNFKSSFLKKLTIPNYLK